MKYLVVEMSDKSQWAIPAKLIAVNRARYYAQLDVERGDSEYAKVSKKEIEYAMSVDYEITDWAANNMDWEDIWRHAIRLATSPPEINYHREWINAPKFVKELTLEDESVRVQKV